MNARRLAAVARKEWTHVLRDYRSLGMAFVIPLLLLILFGYAITLDVTTARLSVLDLDRSVESRAMIRAFDASGLFVVDQESLGRPALEQKLNLGTADVALIIPADLSGDVRRGRPAMVQVLIDGSDATSAQTFRSSAEGVIAAYSAGLHGRSAGGVSVENRTWFNPSRISRNVVVPGLIAVILMVIAALLTSLTIAREYENGTMETLVTTPITSGELLIGKMIPYLGIGAADIMIATLTGILLFGVPFRGSVLALAVLSFFFLVGALGLGLFISAVVRNQMLASQFAMVSTFLPAFILSGFMYPIKQMPEFLQAVTYLVPARYLVGALKGIFLKGDGLDDLYGTLFKLFLFAAVILAASFVALRRRIA